MYNIYNYKMYNVLVQYDMTHDNIQHSKLTTYNLQHVRTAGYMYWVDLDVDVKCVSVVSVNPEITLLSYSYMHIHLILILHRRLSHRVTIYIILLQHALRASGNRGPAAAACRRCLHAVQCRAQNR